MTIKNIRKNTLLLASVAFLALSGCTPTVTQRGNMLEDYQVNKIITGVHTRSDVLRLLGSPTTQAPFDDNVWYYLGQETEKHGILDPEVVNERIVVVSFNEEGLVQSIRDMSPEREEVPIARSKTPTHGNEVTVMQQLLGNIGKFNKSGDSGSGI